MRFAELNLERYGRFEGCRLQFPKAERDFHLIYGPNEAGKSTTMAAVVDLLFGFRPNRADYAFRFDPPLLRVGATLERDGQPFECRRKRGRQGTLIYANENAVDDGPLLAMLHGQTRETFRLSSSLDHARLREGGRAMVESRDDLGQALFAAGSGLTRLRSTMANLDQEIDAIWGPHRAERRAFTRAEREFLAAKGVLRQASVKPADWARARNEFEQLQEELSSLEGRRRALSEELAAVERLRRIYEPMRRRASLLTESEAADTLVLPELVETAAAAALTQAAEAKRTREAAVALLTQAKARLDAEPADSVILPLADRIERLIEGLGAESDRQAQLPRRKAELEERRQEAAGAARSLGLDLSEEAAVRLPADTHVAALRQLATRYAELEVLESSRRGAGAAAAAALSAAEEALERALPPEGLDVLEAAINAVRRAGDIDERLEEREVQQRRAKELLEVSLARLAPWDRDPSTLTSLTPLPDAAIESAQQALETAERDAAEARRLLEALRDEHSRMTAQASNLGEGGQAVSSDALGQARADRNTIWSALSAHLTGEAPLASVETQAVRFDGALQRADELADRRFASAQTSARLVQLEAEIADRGVALTQAQVRLDEAQAKTQSLRLAWDEKTTAAGNPNLPPAELRAWLSLRVAALDEVRKFQEAADAATTARRQRDEAHATLSAALGSVIDEAASVSVSALLTRAELRQAELRQQADAFTTQKRELQAAQTARQEAERQLDDVARDRGAWQTRWDAALLEAGLALAPEAADLRLGVFETLRGQLAAVRDLEGRVQAMNDDAQRFAAEANAVAASAEIEPRARGPLELVDELRARLVTAREVQGRRRELEGQIANFQAEVDRADAALSAADASLADARRLTGLDDHTALAAALERSNAVRMLNLAIASADREIAAHSDGLSVAELETAVGEQTAHDLAERVRWLSSQIEVVADQLMDAGTRATEAKVRFEALDPGSAAADAAAEMEQARAEMEAQGELYVLKRAQRVILDWAVRRHAEQRRTPLLSRASALFRVLTLERYADLRVDYDLEQPRLFGLCEDGATLVSVEDMSEGTQDQLFLALRLAAVEQSMSEGMRLPFLADDLFVSFDDDRARAGLQVLGELARSTQVLFFTHHAHLRSLALEVFGSDALSSCELAA